MSLDRQGIHDLLDEILDKGNELVTAAMVEMLNVAAGKVPAEGATLLTKGAEAFGAVKALVSMVGPQKEPIVVDHKSGKPQ